MDKHLCTIGVQLELVFIASLDGRIKVYTFYAPVTICSLYLWMLAALGILRILRHHVTGLLTVHLYNQPVEPIPK